jgi:hypothetical protein
MKPCSPLSVGERGWGEGKQPPHPQPLPHKGGRGDRLCSPLSPLWERGVGGVRGESVRTFRIAITGDFLNEEGRPAYGSAELPRLDEAAHVRYRFLMEHAPRRGDPGYWERFYSMVVTAEQIRDVDGLVVLRPVGGGLRQD